MKQWIVGLFLFAAVAFLIQGQVVTDDDGEYELKRFHVQSRQLNGRPHCYMTRRKRSSKSLEDEEADYLGAPIDFDEIEDNEDEDDDGEIDDDDNFKSDDKNPSGFLITDSNSNGEGGILVIQNGGPSSQPLLFQVRPIESDGNDEVSDSYLKSGDDNDPDADEEVYEVDDDSLGANNYNRIKPSSELKPFTDSDSNEYMDNAPPRRPGNKRKTNPVSTTTKKPPTRSKKPKHSTRRPSATIKKPNRKKKPNENQNKNKQKSQKKKKPSRGQNPSVSRKKNFKHRLNNNAHKNNRLSVSLNKGSGTRTITNTVTTTQTGTADDNPDVNCIVINKPPPATTEAPLWGLLGRNTDNNGAERSFGLRKRIKKIAQ